MRPVSPSWIVYFIFMAWLMGILDKERTSWFWPIALITSILGFMMILCSFVCPQRYLDAYTNVFWLPLTEALPEQKALVYFLAVLFKICVLTYFPRNYEYLNENLLGLGAYAIVALLMSQ